MDALDTALGEFGQSLGISGLAFGEEDECQLEIGGTFLDLLADRAGQRLVFSALAAELPRENRAELLQRLLDGNCHPAMAGGRIGVPTGSDAVIVIREIGAGGLNGSLIAAAIELFLAAVDHARSLIGGASGRAAGAEAGSPSYSDDTMVLRL